MTTEPSSAAAPWPARGFGPGLAAEGAPVACRRVGAQVHIDGWPGLTTLPLADAAVSRRGDRLLLEWATAAGPCALSLDAALAAKVGAGGTAHRPGHDRATRGWLWAALGGLVGLPLLVLVLLVGFRAALLDAATGWIPVAREQQLADRLWPMQRAQLRLIEDSAAQRAVAEIGARLVAARPTPYVYRFHLADEPTVNAFAMPAGYIVVHRGLLERASSAEQVAGVLAHEIEHVEGRHALRGMVQALGMQAVWLLLTGDLSGGLAGDGLRQLAGLHFSREQETAADLGGHARLLAAGIDPGGMAEFFAELAREQATLPALLSSHPASAERAARLAQLRADRPPLPSLPPLPPLPYDWPAIQASLKDKATP